MNHTIDDPAAGPWCPPGGCPHWNPARVQHALAYAYAKGRADQWADIAEAGRPAEAVTRPMWEQWVAQRIESMQPSKELPPLRLDDPEWPPVAVPGMAGLRIGPNDIIPAGATP